MTRRLFNDTRGSVLAERLEVALTPLARMRGLLGRNRFEPGQGLIIEDCWSIHTWFVKFPIDVLFVDANLVVKKIVPGLGPWKLASSAASSHTVELPAGTLDCLPVEVGDVLRIEREPPPGAKD